MPTSLLGRRQGLLLAGADTGGGVPASPLLTDLVSYWKLDEASGNAVDSHSTNHLTDVNTVTSGAGKQGTARQFAAASTEYLSAASNASLQTGDVDWTIALWVYNDGLPGGGAARNFLGKISEWWLGVYTYPPTQFLFQVSPDGSSFVALFDTVTTPVADDWVFLVAWHDATANTINVQANNGTVASMAHSTGILANASAFQIGYADPWPMNGRIDEVGFWKRVLTPAEKTYLYNSGAGRTYPFA